LIGFLALGCFPDPWREGIEERKELRICLGDEAESLGNNVSYASRYWNDILEDYGCDMKVTFTESKCDTSVTVEDTEDWDGFWNSIDHELFISKQVLLKDELIQANVVAHEIGHALGFFHSKEDGNVMHPNEYGFGLSKETIDEMTSRYNCAIQDTNILRVNF
jgi:hypothetical protein